MRISLPEINSDGSYETEPSPMAIDADGANGETSLPVYASKGMESLDYLANAGTPEEKDKNGNIIKPANWYGIITNTGKPNGKPVIQKQNHPAPGAFVSATSYEKNGFSRGDPARYVDANEIIYIVLPGHWRAEARGIVLGCKALVTDTKTKKKTLAVVADFGPKSKLGEASIACARFFGIPSSPKNGGTEEKRFVYQFWPGIAADGFELQAAK